MKYTLRQIVGIILWWAEGSKTRRDKRWKNSWTNNVEVTNTDPNIMKIFLDFLRNDIGVDEKKLKLQLQIHEGDDQEKMEKFWSEVAKIPRSRFNRTIIRRKGNKPGKSQGTCKVRYCKKETYKKLDNLLQDIVSKLIGV